MAGLCGCPVAGRQVIRRGGCCRRWIHQPLVPQWPQRIQAIELEKLYKALDKTAKIAPLFLLRLDPQSPAALTPHWQLVNVEPAKHSAYAMQWFGMALLLVVLFAIASLRRQRHDKVPCNE